MELIPHRSSHVLQSLQRVLCVCGVIKHFFVGGGGGRGTGLPYYVFVVYCAFLISVLVYELPKLNAKFKSFKTEENEMAFAVNGPIFFVGLVVYPK